MHPRPDALLAPQLPRPLEHAEIEVLHNIGRLLCATQGAFEKSQETGVCRCQGTLDGGAQGADRFSLFVVIIAMHL